MNPWALYRFDSDESVMTFLYLTESDVNRLLTIDSVLPIVERAFLELANHQADNVPRRRARAGSTVLHNMSAAAEYLGVVGLKAYTTTKQGARFYVSLFDAASGELLAMLEADRLGQLRTGAVTGVALKYLAPNATSLGLIGTGYQAETQLAAAAAVLPLQTVRVFGRDPERRQEFARKMSAQHGLAVTPMASAAATVDGLPVVITATSSSKPVLDVNDLASGTLVCATGSNWPQKAELDVATVRRAELVVCDSVAACELEAGDFREALAQQVFSWDRAVELGDIVAGKMANLNQPRELTIFKSVGLAIEDVAVAHEVVRLAKEQGVGRLLSSSV
jgi:ornithine cyclodeaminase/alanine dehydrogenase-like protein (mu-crystallin family)